MVKPAITMEFDQQANLRIDAVGTAAINAAAIATDTKTPGNKDAVTDATTMTLAQAVNSPGPKEATPTPSVRLQGAPSTAGNTNKAKATDDSSLGSDTDISELMQHTAARRRERENLYNSEDAKGQPGDTELTDDDDSISPESTPDDKAEITKGAPGDGGENNNEGRANLTTQALKSTDTTSPDGSDEPWESTDTDNDKEEDDKAIPAKAEGRDTDANNTDDDDDEHAPRSETTTSEAIVKGEEAESRIAIRAKEADKAEATAAAATALDINMKENNSESDDEYEPSSGEEEEAYYTKGSEYRLEVRREAITLADGRSTEELLSQPVQRLRSQQYLEAMKSAGSDKAKAPDADDTALAEVDKADATKPPTITRVLHSVIKQQEKSKKELNTYNFDMDTDDEENQGTPQAPLHPSVASAATTELVAAADAQMASDSSDTWTWEETEDNDKAGDADRKQPATPTTTAQEAITVGSKSSSRSCNGLFIS